MEESSTDVVQLQKVSLENSPILWIHYKFHIISPTAPTKIFMKWVTMEKFRSMLSSATSSRSLHWGMFLMFQHKNKRLPVSCLSVKSGNILRNNMLDLISAFAAVSPINHWYDTSKEKYCYGLHKINQCYIPSLETDNCRLHDPSTSSNQTV